jgi:hypothetical protein
MTPLRRARRRRLPPPLASLLFSLAALATLPMANAADATAPAADARDAGSDGNILFSVLQPARAVAAGAVSSLGQQVVAPSGVTSAGGSARQLTPCTWHVPQHQPLESFLNSTGPPEIVRYNLHFVKRLQKEELIRRQPFLGSGKYSADARVNDRSTEYYPRVNDRSC